MATNLARDAHRRARLRPWLGRQAAADVEGLEGLEAPGAPGHLDQKRDLDRAMLRLKPRDRAMLWLAYAEGSTHREIAAALGLNAGSVKLMLFRARRKLSLLLGHAPAPSARSDPKEPALSEPNESKEPALSERGESKELALSEPNESKEPALSEPHESKGPALSERSESKG